jgi:hypothetical protein
LLWERLAVLVIKKMVGSPIRRFLSRGWTTFF